MKTIQIKIDKDGKPKASPDAEVCLSGETIVFVVASENSLITAVNLAFEDTAAHILLCPTGTPGAKDYRCTLALHESKDPEYPKVAVVWGLALEHKDDLPKSLKYSITPWVGKDLDPTLTLDPWIVITKRP